jgi:hypothetical protein
MREEAKAGSRKALGNHNQPDRAIPTPKEPALSGAEGGLTSQAGGPQIEVVSQQKVKVK